MSENTSRREFLKLAGKGVLGAAALSTVPAMLPALAVAAIPLSDMAQRLRPAVRRQADDAAPDPAASGDLQLF